jgi:hypothetical protein
MTLRAYRSPTASFEPPPKLGQSLEVRLLSGILLIFWLWNKVQGLLVCSMQMLNKLWNIIAMHDDDSLLSESANLLDAHVTVCANVYLCSISRFDLSRCHGRNSFNATNILFAQESLNTWVLVVTFAVQGGAFHGSKV